jgi:hypothetical protein
MADKKLMRIVELSAVFKDAVEGKLGNDAALAKKAQAALKPGELEQVQGKMEDVMNESFELMFGKEPTDSFLQKNLDLLEWGAEFTLRVVPVERVAECMPAELKSEDNIAELQKRGAPTLAKIAAFKP